jgi:hypothetical protein
MNEWSVEWLKSIGFEGFVPVERGSVLAPDGPGTYVVLRDSVDDPAFAELSKGGWFKGKDPAVAVEALSAKWVIGAVVVYIGQSGGLRRRIRQLARFGVGKPVGHWGGRYLWQLNDCPELIVAWRRDDQPVTGEQRLLAGFTAHYGRMPFANLS